MPRPFLRRDDDDSCSRNDNKKNSEEEKNLTDPSLPSNIVRHALDITCPALLFLIFVD